MPKTPDEIKKGLECCCNEDDCLSECPYFRNCDGDGFALERDALALIQQLQAENAEKDGRIKQLEAERDALAADFKLYRERNIKGECGVYACDLCKHGGKYEEWEEIKCPKGCMGLENWEWRGVQKEDDHA